MQILNQILQFSVEIYAHRFYLPTRWKTEVMTSSTLLSSPLQLGCRLLSFASSPACPRTGGCLCVSGCDVQDKWSLDFWQVINGRGFISLLLVRALAASESIWEPAAQGWGMMREGPSRTCFCAAWCSCRPLLRWPLKRHSTGTQGFLTIWLAAFTSLVLGHQEGDEG